MNQVTSRLRPGDLVEVKTADEILLTLDEDGTLDRLPFMPEMVEYCGKSFPVARRVVKTCSYGTASTMLAFNTDDVIILDGLRCCGSDHDGCPKACMIFWREAWLRKVRSAPVQSTPDSRGSEQLRARLKTKSGPTKYFCQASELLKAGHELSRAERFRKCLDEVRAGNCSSLQMARRIGIWLFWRIRRALLGAYGKGSKTTTPVENLNLQPGELVEVKSMESITRTLNETAHNRGLWFSPDQRLLCGQQKRVIRRIDKLIVDGTGEMRQLRNTVFLEGSMCGCSHVAFGGCPRAEFVYWREAWLRRPDSSRGNTGSSGS
jgi:hypothetical protein